MSEELENKYIRCIKDHEGIVHKVIGLYVDSEEDRKDLYQEILYQGWKSFKKFGGRSTFGTWLYKVSLNTALTWVKKKKVYLPESDIREIETEAKNEDIEVLYAIIKSMDDIDKMMITLHLEGFKNKEIGDIIGVSVNHVGVKIHRLKKVIMEKFKTLDHE